MSARPNPFNRAFRVAIAATEVKAKGRLLWTEADGTRYALDLSEDVIGYAPMLSRLGDAESPPAHWRMDEGFAWRPCDEHGRPR